MYDVTFEPMPTMSRQLSNESFAATLINWIWCWDSDALLAVHAAQQESGDGEDEEDDGDALSFVDRADRRR
jgi:hypothetical protein